MKVSDRELSKAEYVEKLRQLCILVGHATANAPAKHMKTYGDRLVHAALDAYAAAMKANSIYPSKGVRAEHDYLQRRGYLLEARGCVDAVAAIAGIFLQLVADSCHAKGDSKGRNKAYARMERIGIACDECYKLLGGVMKWDTDQFKRYNNG